MGRRNDSDYEQESNSEIKFETNRETKHRTSYEETIHMRSLESDYNSISVSNSKSTNEGDFGHNIRNNNKESSETFIIGTTRLITRIITRSFWMEASIIASLRRPLITAT